MTGDSTLVTVHRAGVRLHRERLQPMEAKAGSPPSLATREEKSPSNRLTVPTGIWDLIEARSDLHVKEAYLSTAMQPIVVEDSIFHSKYHRYFAVAAGSDRLTHSICVMSSGAHFGLHHEAHGPHRVVCLSCTAVARASFMTQVVRPVVVSVDEVGGVVLYDIERDQACPLETVAPWTKRRNGGGRDQLRAPGTADAELRVVQSLEAAAQTSCAAYQLDEGVATRVALVGPCVEMCNRCHNDFAGVPGYTMMSVVICSRAKDVPEGGEGVAAPQDVAAERNDVSLGESAVACSRAELNVVLLRVLWGPSRAFVWEEHLLIRETAPADVCDVGVAMHVRPYQVGRPMTVLLARPALQLLCLSGCTGESIQEYRVGDASSSLNLEWKRPSSEWILQWIPLGRHQLQAEGEEHRSWFCIAALTDDGTVLLLGNAPKETAGGGGCCAADCDKEGVVGGTGGSLTQRGNPHDTSILPGVGPNPDLEAWLDDVVSPSPLPAEETDSVTVANSTSRPASPPAAPAYTILMELYSQRGRLRRSSPSRPSTKVGGAGTAGVQGIIADLPRSTLLLRMVDEDSMQRIRLPFSHCLKLITEQKSKGISQTGAGGADDCGCGIPHPGSGTTSPSATPPRKSLNSYLWSATSKAMKAAAASTTGWSTSVQGFVPSSTTPYFSFLHPSRNGSTSATAQAGPLEQPPERPVTTHEDPTAVPGGSHTSDVVRANAAVKSASATTASWSTKIKEEQCSPSSTSAALPSSTLRSTAPLGVLGGFSIARPLMSAVLYVTGDEDDNDDRGKRASSHTSVVDATTSASLVSPRSAPEVRASSCSSAAVTGLVTAVPIRIADTKSRSLRGSPTHRSAASTTDRRHRRLRNMSQSEGTCQSPLEVVDMKDRAAYLQRQMMQLTEGNTTSTTAEREEQSSMMLRGHAEYLVHHLMEVAEPLERNKVLYQWRDGHDNLYIDFASAIEELCKQQSALRCIQKDESRGVEQFRFTFVLEGIEAGLHSARFLAAARAAAEQRARTQSYGDCFDFETYFQTLQPPQHLIDLQERDKCTFELADLRLQQNREIAPLQPYHTVRVYQNEERSTAAAPWTLHSTFPYDDQDGRPVDLSTWNRFAASEPASQPWWRWATPLDLDKMATLQQASGQSDSQPSTSRIRILSKELKDWSVGPWKYAERWPSSGGIGVSSSASQNGDASQSFEWSSEPSPQARCRCRELTRVRVELHVLKQREEMFLAHQRELEALRDELGM